MNSINIIGRLTNEVEIKTTQSGLSVTSFSVAVDRGTKDANGNRITDFIPCVAWRQSAEFISRYFSKGDMIGITGTLQQRNYTDKDGNKRTAYEVLVDRTSFCGSKSESNNNADVNVDTSGFEEVSMSDEDLPF